MGHTPGPWEMDRDDEGLIIRMETLAGVDHYLTVYASPNPEQREADARLIAAAPELLEALEGVLRTDDSKFRLSDDDWTIFRSIARAAIAKARGKEDATARHTQPN